ncbi:class I SAM-dependent methyltransferase [Rudaea sp.]|uniref:class I SAM-dependent methyltransferase n=1 Tax=Rudaea sp. TaxID=2136325 RepID=UPI002ED1EAEE
MPQNGRNRLRAWQLKSLAAWHGRHDSNVPSTAESTDIERDCRFCAAARVRHHIVGNVAPTHPGPFEHEDYRLLRCSLCDVVYLDPQPSDRDLQTLYQDSVQFSDKTYSDDAAALRVLDSYARRIDRLGLVPAAVQSILEVGAGLAWVARACKQRSPRVHTVAQDISAECAAACPWVDEYVVGTIQVVSREPRFALASMTHVIEHLTDPAAMLVELEARMLRGGCIYITAPHRPPLWKPCDGIRSWLRYSYLHVPAHIAYLSQTWLRQAAMKARLELVHWDETHDGHQVFEAVLRKP